MQHALGGDPPGGVLLVRAQEKHGQHRVMVATQRRSSVVLLGQHHRSPTTPVLSDTEEVARSSSTTCVSATPAPPGTGALEGRLFRRVERHRVGEFLFLLQPAIADTQHLVASGGCVGAAAAQDVAEEVFEVGPGRFLELLAAAFQKLSASQALSRWLPMGRSERFCARRCRSKERSSEPGAAWWSMPQN